MPTEEIAVCEKHKEEKTLCLVCDLVKENFWKEKYFKTAQRLTATVEELLLLEERLEKEKTGAIA